MKHITSAGVVGAGNMGSGIVQKLALEGYPVVMVDIDESTVNNGLARIKGSLSEGVERKILSPDRVKNTLQRITTTADFNDLKNVDVVIEAVFEELTVKTSLFEQLSSIINPQTIVGSNTSSYSINDLADHISRPERFLGLHFFYHPAKNRLLEIIPGKATSPKVITSCTSFFSSAGKIIIKVLDSPGFAVNRFFVPWLNESVRLLDEGIANIASIDEAARQSFKIGMGPFQLMNVSGIPIAYHSARTLGRELGQFYETADGLTEQFKKGRPWPLDGDIDESSMGVIKERLLAVVFYVASQLVQENVSTPTDIDMAAKIGLRWKLGPFELMNRFGIGTVENIVQKLVSAHPSIHMPDNLARQAGEHQPWPLSYVDLSISGDTATITIKRPEAMNALNETVVKQLEQTFLRVESMDEIKAVVIEGSGKAFIAGADIGFFIRNIKEKNFDRIYDFARYGQTVFNRIDQSSKLVVAKVDGTALGGGVELALAADIIVATEKASFGFPETGIGIYPGLGGTQRTARFVGTELARYLVFTGAALDAESARSIGLIEYVVPASKIDDKISEIIHSESPLTKASNRIQNLPQNFAQLKQLFTDENLPGLLRPEALESEDPLTAKIAGMISRKAPLAIEKANFVITGGSRMTLEDGLKLETDNLEAVFMSEDGLEGLTSLGKKRPDFKGK